MQHMPSNRAAPVTVTNHLDGVAPSLIATAKQAMRDAGLPVDMRRVVKHGDGRIEIDLDGTIEEVIARREAPPARKSRRRA